MEVNRRGRSLVCLRDRKNAQKFQQFGRNICSRRFQNGIFAKKQTRILREEIWLPFFMPMCHALVERNTIIYIIFSICYLWQGLFFSICYLWKGKGNSWYGPGVSVAGIILGLPCQWPIHKRIIITTLIFTHICFTYVKDVRTFATSLAFLQHFAYRCYVVTQEF